MKKQLFSFILLASLMCACLFPSAVRASELPLQGTAEVLSTGNTFDFDQYNSDVVADSETGNLTGHVWSEDLGWIDFDNNGEGDSAAVNLDDGTVTGRAYASNTGTRVYFSEYNSNVEIDLENGGISGYAWSDDLGWISYSSVEVPGGFSPSDDVGDDVVGPEETDPEETDPNDTDLGDTGQNILPWVVVGGLFGSGIILTRKREAKG